MKLFVKMKMNFPHNYLDMNIFLSLERTRVVCIYLKRISKVLTDGVYFLVNRNSGICQYDTLFCLFIFHQSTFYVSTSEPNGVELFINVINEVLPQNSDEYY